MRAIQAGDRVQWTHREERWFGARLLPAKILTGKVREVKRSGACPVGSGDYAWVETDPDGRLCMAEYDKLERLEPVTEA